MKGARAAGSMDEAEKHRRRKLALQKLARVFKGDEPARRPASNAYGVLAERKILTTILRTTTQPEIANLVRDRLAVISLDSDSDADDAPTPAPAAAANEAKARLEAEKSAEVTTWLREVANGTRPVPGILASPEYWEELGAPARDAANARGRERYRARMKLRARCEPALAPGETIVWPHLGDDYNDERLSLIRQHLRENGYAQFPSFAVAAPDRRDENGDVVAGTAGNASKPPPPPSKPPSHDGLSRERGSWRWEGARVPVRVDDVKRRDLLRSVVDRMRSFGAWSPAAAFMYDATWQIIDAAFDVAGVLLDADPDAGEVTLEPSCFAWALRCVDEADPDDAGDEDGENGNANVEGSNPGGNFSLPHRDYPASEAWNASSDAPNLVSAWIPLTDATTDNGCVYVLPRRADAIWSDGSHPDHLAPATREEGGGASLRFDVSRAVPMIAKAGSVCAWAGQTVHWGGACGLRRDECDWNTRAVPRRSVACTFRLAGDDKSKGKGKGKGAANKDNGKDKDKDKVDGNRKGTDFTQGSSALAPMTRDECRRLTLEGRFRLLAQSLLLYSGWHPVPGALRAETIELERRDGIRRLRLGGSDRRVE